MRERLRKVSIDHVVLNTLYDMDEAQACLASIGFSLTPRGYHSLGSINHLVVLKDSYLELVGLPVNTNKIRKELLEHPKGINGLVFSEDDPASRHARLQEMGIPVQFPQNFSRPVECSDGILDASFTAVRIAAETFPAGRVYFCQHHTPELVWRDEWSVHANTAYSLAGLTIVSFDPKKDAFDYGRCIDETPEPADDGFLIRLAANRLDQTELNAKIKFTHDELYRQRFELLSCERFMRESYFGVVNLRVTSIEAVLDSVRSSPLDIHHAIFDDNTVAVSLPALNCLFEFKQECIDARFE